MNIEALDPRKQIISSQNASLAQVRNKYVWQRLALFGNATKGALEDHFPMESPFEPPKTQLKKIRQQYDSLHIV